MSNSPNRDAREETRASVPALNIQSELRRPQVAVEHLFSASFTEAPFVGIFVGNFVDCAFADKVCDKDSDKDGTRRW